MDLPGMDRAKEILEALNVIHTNVARVGQAEWYPVIAQIASQYLELEDWSDADICSEGLLWMCVALADLPAPVEREKIIDLILDLPLLRWRAKLARQLWDIRKQHLELFLDENTPPGRAPVGVIVWEEPEQWPPRWEMRQWLLDQVGGSRDQPRGAVS